MLAGLSPEFQALCLTVGHAIGAGVSAGQVAQALLAVEQWDDFIDGARLHRVSTIILPCLRMAPAGTVPEDVLAQINRQGLINARRGLWQIGELSRLQKLFDQAELKVILLKGVGLSQQLYATPTMRGVGDLDFLIAPDDVVLMHEVMTQAGYGPLGELTVLNYLKDLPYRHPNGHVAELHVHLLDNRAILDPDFAQLWDQRAVIDVAGITLSVLPPAILPLYLAAHGANHCWNRLCWLADLARLLPDKSLREQALREAEITAMTAILRHALALADGWFGGGSTFAGRDGNSSHWFVRVFFSRGRWLENHLQRGSRAWFRREMTYKGWLLLQGRNWPHFRGALILMLCNPVDHSIFPLPRGLAWLYPLLRPVGWVVRNFIRKE